MRKAENPEAEHPAANAVKRLAPFSGTDIAGVVKNRVVPTEMCGCSGGTSCCMWLMSDNHGQLRRRRDRKSVV